MFGETGTVSDLNLSRMVFILLVAVGQSISQSLLYGASNRSAVGNIQYAVTSVSVTYCLILLHVSKANRMAATYEQHSPRPAMHVQCADKMHPSFPTISQLKSSLFHTAIKKPLIEHSSTIITFLQLCSRLLLETLSNFNSIQ